MNQFVLLLAAALTCSTQAFAAPAQPPQVKIHAKILRHSYEKVGMKFDWKTEVVCEKDATVGRWNLGDPGDMDQYLASMFAIKCPTLYNGKKLDVTVGGSVIEQDNDVFGAKQTNLMVSASLVGGDLISHDNSASTIYIPGRLLSAVGFDLSPAVHETNHLPGATNSDYFTATAVIGN